MLSKYIEGKKIPFITPIKPQILTDADRIVREIRDKWV